MKRTLWQRIRRQIKIIIVWLRDLLYLENEPFDDDENFPTPGKPDHD